MNKYIFLKDELTIQSVERLKNFPIYNHHDLIRSKLNLILDRSFSSELNFHHSDNE